VQGDRAARRVPDALCHPVSIRPRVVGSLTVLVGLVLYGAATLQARVLPPWCGLGLIVVPPIAFYMNSKVYYGSLALFGVLWVALGYVLWSRRDTPTEQQPSRVR